MSVSATCGVENMLPLQNSPISSNPRHGDAALPGIDLKGEINKIRKSMLNLVDTCDASSRAVLWQFPAVSSSGGKVRVLSKNPQKVQQVLQVFFWLMSGGDGC